ncbi:Uncharacterised protein [uncultured archaeon]|nr:Uncharacterised protein [uncultured archaeon]
MNLLWQGVRFIPPLTRIMINGLSSGANRGLIIEVQDDYIVYELCEVLKEKHSGKEKQKKEVKYIPISSIFDLSEGEKEIVNAPNLSTFNP